MNLAFDVMLKKHFLIVLLFHRWLFEVAKPVAMGKQRKPIKTPNVGLEPTTLRLRVSCSTD